MTIKDVEKETGLTLKSVRYYEEKGLINIKRNENNAYRNYSEEDVERLKLIKLLRYINFSVEEISGCLENDEFPQALKKKSKQLEEEKNLYLDKQSICNSLLDDYKKKDFKKVVNDYCETIDFLENDEIKELKFGLLSSLCPSLSSVIVQSLIFAAPIIWLFVNIYNQRWDTMLFNSISALMGMFFLVSEWGYYIYYRKNNEELQKEKSKNNSLIIPVAIISIVLCIGIFVLLNIGLELFAPKDYLFFENSLMVIIIIVLFSYFFKKFNLNKVEDLEVYLDIWKKFKYALMIIIIAITYCFFTSVTYITNDKIVYHSPLHPLGITYNLSEVTKIETGFGKKNFSFIDYNRKGQFYYRIYIDGKKITFSTPSANGKIEKYENDSYLELEEFDEKLKQYNIEKQGDLEYAKLCDLDREFCERFERIINN